jgi:hypothetical protein
MGGASTKRAVAVLVLAAAIVAVGAGCGSGSKTGGAGSSSNAALTPYENAMLALGNKLYLTIAGIDKANRNAGGPTVIERNLRKTQIELRAAAVKLTKIVPPARIKAQHVALIRGVREFADELDGVIAKLKKGSGPAVLGTLPSLKGIRDMTAASTAITKAGYVIAIANG